MQDLMTPRQVMDRLQISRSTLFRMIKTGTFVPVMLGPRLMRFKPAEVNRVAGGKDDAE